MNFTLLQLCSSPAKFTTDAFFLPFVTHILPTHARISWEEKKLLAKRFDLCMVFGQKCVSCCIRRYHLWEWIGASIHLFEGIKIIFCFNQMKRNEKIKYHCARHLQWNHLIQFLLVHSSFLFDVWSVTFCVEFSFEHRWYVVVEIQIYSHNGINEKMSAARRSDRIHLLMRSLRTVSHSLCTHLSEYNATETHVKDTQQQLPPKTTKSFSRDISDFSTNCFSDDISWIEC